MEISDIISSYENMYNQTLAARYNYDSKMVSRFSLLSLVLSLWALQSKPLLVNSSTNFLFEFREIISMINPFSTRFNLLYILFCTSFILMIIQLVYFYKSFFRTRKNYMEMPLAEIRMWHQKIEREREGNKKRDTHNLHRYSIITPEEESLFSYIKDSYLFCAYKNAYTNQRRAKSLNAFDNVTVTNFLLVLVCYYFLYLKGVGLEWIVGI